MKKRLPPVGKSKKGKSFNGGRGSPFMRGSLFTPEWKAPSGDGALAQQRGGAFAARVQTEKAAREAAIQLQKDTDYAWRYLELRFEIDKFLGARSADLIKLIISDSRHVKSPRDYEWLAHKAMSNGAKRKSYNTIDWPIHGDCQDRFTQTFKAAPYLDAKGRKTKRTYAIYIDIHTRCRKCEKCLAYRAALWRARALSVYRRSLRTWAGTLTLSQPQHTRFRFAAIKRATLEGFTFESLSGDEQFARIDAEIYAELKKGWKRLRTNTGKPFRYMVVTEAHKSGQPHYHFLLHEMSEEAIRYAELKRDLWSAGFSRYKLVSDSAGAQYLCKYLTKSLRARVRASQRYGCEQPTIGLQIVNGMNVKTTTPKTKSLF